MVISQNIVLFFFFVKNPTYYF